MRYPTGEAFRAALEERLNLESAAAGMSIARLRKLVAFDRLLARLLWAAPDRWIAKGGLMLTVRFGGRARTTMDLDLASLGDRESMLDDLLTALAINSGDFFSFELDDADRDVDPRAEGVERYRILASLGGRVFEELRVDIAFEGPLRGQPETIAGVRLLGFADLGPIEIPVLPLADQVGEKVHAYTLTYPGERHSTRVKDLIDLVLISSACEFEAGSLADALRSTFQRRATHDLPRQLTRPPEGWAIAYRRLASEIELDGDLQAGYAAAAAFLDPILQGPLPLESVWHPDARRWLERR